MQKISINMHVNAVKLPPKTMMKKWLTRCFGKKFNHAELHIDFVGKAKMQKLNAEYRQKNYPTNVLSFRNTLPLPGKQQFLGNLILCPEVIQKEAKAQGKSLKDHVAHLLIHGCLHLLGFDHENAKEAKTMESLEIRLLKKLGIAHPYA